MSHELFARRPCARLILFLLLPAALGLLLAGCGAQSGSQSQTSTPPPTAQAAGVQGSVFGGRQPIVGATVVAYAAATTVGAAPTEIGNTVTDSSGNFTMSFSPTPAAGQVVYATGGDAGGGTNSAIGLMTVAGVWGSTLAPPAATVNINELTTVAATAALKDYIGFADCSTLNNNNQIGTCVSIPGALDLTNMAATVNNLVNVESGRASDFLAMYSTAPGAPLTATLQKLDTLASVIAACVNASGPTDAACAGLFAATGGLQGQQNTLMAAWMVAKMAAVNAKGAALYALTPGTPVYTPVLAAAPATFAAGFWTMGGERYAFAANYGSNNVSMYTTTGGALTPIGPAVATEMEPHGVAVDPSGRYVYVGNRLSNTVSMYTIGSGGALTAIGTIGAGNAPQSVAVDPSGRYVYVANGSGGNAGNVSMYTIGSGGALTALGTIAAGDAAVAVDPSGRYVYVANATSNNVSMYTIGPGGALTANGTIAAGNGPSAVAVDPSGRYVYVANYDNNNVSAYAIGTGGTLTPVAGSPFTAEGYQPTWVAVDPSGHYLYVVNLCGSDATCRSAGNVSAHTIGSGGVLAAIGTVGAGTYPYSIAVGP